jgi:hypothetical protein
MVQNPLRIASCLELTSFRSTRVPLLLLLEDEETARIFGNQGYAIIQGIEKEGVGRYFLADQ